jgi:hypothetical protein
MKTRICGSCKVEKIEAEPNFRLCKYKSGTLYYSSICRECERIRARTHARAHKEERREYTRNFIINNPQYGKEWKKRNRKRLREQENERRATDINFKLKKNVSRAVSHAIKKSGMSSFKCLPYTTQELREHLEKQFDSKMSWDNYGDYWHIDHIIPHSMFKYTSMNDEEFKKCWSLSNLRPLEAKQNQIDGGTRIRHKR